jgi:predicted TIM-barrel fold metal-dependent hydrolase
MLKRTEQTPEKARFPVIDFHNHLFGTTNCEKLLQVMDEVGVSVFNNVTGNAVLPYVDNTYTIERLDFSVYATEYLHKYPHRFTAFTMSDFAQWGDFRLFKSADFVEQLIVHLQEDVAAGARGLKLTKELGLRFTDADGNMLRIDDERFNPVWHTAAKLDIPVLIHVSDPAAFFLANNPTNEHYQTLQEFPAWSFYGSTFSKNELLQQRNTVIARHPATAFVLPHVANHPEDLSSVADVMNRLPNVFIDFSARIDELGRQPYTARDFFLTFQDRILFGVDMPVSVEVYRCYFRFLETRDEYFDYPDYLGRWRPCRWKIYGLDLPDPVLKKIYFKNASRFLG